MNATPILHHRFLCLAHSVCCVFPFPSFKKTETEVSHFHPGLFLTPADFLLPSQLLPFSSSLPAGSASVLLTKITLSTPVCTQFHICTGKAGLGFSQEKQALLVCEACGFCAHRSLFNQWLAEHEQRGWLSSAFTELTVQSHQKTCLCRAPEWQG